MDPKPSTSSRQTFVELNSRESDYYDEEEEEEEDIMMMESEELSNEEEDEFEEGTEEEETESIEKKIKDVQLRQATSEYLAGNLSLVEYASILDSFKKESIESKEKLSMFKNITSSGEIDITQSLFSSQDESLNLSRAEQLPAESIGGFYDSGKEMKSFSVRIRRKLTATLQRMLGQANLSYAQGDWETAVKICLEVIKEQPTCIEPFLTLAMIYENQGSIDKALQYGLVAGLLDPKHYEDWCKLGEMSLQQRNLPQALICFNKAIMNDPMNFGYHMKRSMIYEEMKDYRSALKSYLKILQTFPANGKVCVEALRKCAAIHHRVDNLESSYSSLDIAFNKYKGFITSEEINLMLELCISMKKYVEALKILITYCQVQFIPSTTDFDSIQSRDEMKSLLSDQRFNCTVTKSCNIDLIAKLIIVLVHLEAFHLSDKLVDLVYEYNVEEFGDIYFDIAEAYMSKQNYSFALNVLTKLVNSKNFSLAAIWLRYAECLFLLNLLEEAATAYQKVVSLAPNHNLARLNLSIILQKLGRPDAALQTLGDELTDDQQIDPELLLERCNILFDKRLYKEFISKCFLLFSRHFPSITSSEDCQVLCLISNRGKKYQSLQNERYLRGSQPIEQHKFLDKQIDILTEWKLYLKLCYVLLQKLGRIDLLTKVTHCAEASKLFGEYLRTEKETEIHCYYATMLGPDPQEMLPFYNRLFLSNCVKSCLMLNLFGLALRNGSRSSNLHPKRYGRHLVRLLQKYPTQNNILLLRAHISFTTLTYKNAVNEYQHLYKQSNQKNNPIIPLMLASVYLHLMVQKANPLNRSRLSLTIIQLIFKYFELRGSCQESFYNLGRMFHILGFYSLAIEYYKRVLEIEPITIDKGSHCQYILGIQQESMLDLKHETCFNLAQLYFFVRNYELGNFYLQKIVV